LSGKARFLDRQRKAKGVPVRRQAVTFVIETGSKRFATAMPILAAETELYPENLFVELPPEEPCGRNLVGPAYPPTAREEFGGANCSSTRSPFFCP